ncbi:MAG: tRNA adenosine(34) deaminase TadA [Pseudomonadota bacterium]
MQKKVDHIRRMTESPQDVRQTYGDFPQNSTTDEYWMRLALQQAKTAGSQGEVPVGAVLVDREGLLAAAGNSPIRLADPSAHAEILALRLAAQQLQNYRLPETTLYVTLEPCIMCMGAMIQARINRLVYGAADPKTGAAISVYAIGSDQRLNHSIAVTGGVLAEQCAELLKVFFRERRSGSLGKNPPFLKAP